MAPKWKSAAVAATTGAVFALAVMWIGFQLVNRPHFGILRTLAAAKGLVAGRSGSSEGTRSKAPPAGESHHSVTLTWKASATPGVRYNVYRHGLVGELIRLNPAPVAGTSYTDYSVQPGQTYFYTTKAVSSARAESSPSNEVRVAIPSL